MGEPNSEGYTGTFTDAEISLEDRLAAVEGLRADCEAVIPGWREKMKVEDLKQSGDVFVRRVTETVRTPTHKYEITLESPEGGETELGMMSIRRNGPDGSIYARVGFDTPDLHYIRDHTERNVHEQSINKPNTADSIRTIMREVPTARQFAGR